MKKTAKRAKTKSSERAKVKPKAKKTAKAKTLPRSKKTAVRAPVSMLKQVATAAVVAAGLAALDTALGQLQPDKKEEAVRPSGDNVTKG